MASSFDTSSCCLLGYMIVAVTTTSSAATLPISIKVAGEKLGVPENIYGFTLPLGDTCAYRSSTRQGGYECL